MEPFVGVRSSAKASVIRTLRCLQRFTASRYWGLKFSKSTELVLPVWPWTAIEPPFHNSGFQRRIRLLSEIFHFFSEISTTFHLQNRGIRRRVKILGYEIQCTKLFSSKGKIQRSSNHSGLKITFPSSHPSALVNLVIEHNSLMGVSRNIFIVSSRFDHLTLSRH